MSSGSTPIQIVGTPAASVTFSPSISSAIAFGCIFGPGIARSAPAITAAWQSPHALAWNIGTTGITRVALGDRGGVGDQRAHRVQDRRAVRVDDALRVAGGAARVTHRGGLVLVLDHRELRPARRPPAAPRSRARAGRRGSPRRHAVVHHDHVLDRLEAVDQRPEDLQQRAVDEDDLVLGVVGDVDDVVREQADVERVQDAAAARRGEVELEVAGGVPGERADAAVRGDPERVEHGREPARALGPLAVGDPLDPAGL